MDRMKKVLLPCICFILLSAAAEVLGQQLVYRPVNPAFGGDTFNYQWLLSSAQAQNLLEEKQSSLLDRNPLTEFESSLQRQILNQLSRKIIDDLFGEGDGGLQEGSYSYGTLDVNITAEAEGVNIKISNSQDGSEIEVLVPYF
jgi:curli production assembly/transport component CsgF